MTHYIISFFLFTSLMFLSASLRANTAEQLYNMRCACCHHDINTVRISESKLKHALTGDYIRAHYFKLSNEELKQIIKYLTEG